MIFVRTACFALGCLVGAMPSFAQAQAPAAEVSLSAPETVAIGRPIPMHWSGPGGDGDRIQVFDPKAIRGKGKVMVQKPLAHGDVAKRTIALPAPAAPGSYLLRYWNGGSGKVLATRTIQVEAAEVSLSAPDSVRIADEFEIAWIGPGMLRDSIELFDPKANDGQGRVLKTIRLVNGDFEERTVRLIAVARPGQYELRFWNGDNRAVLATRPIEIVPVEVSVDGPDRVAPEKPFVATWRGPGAFRDAVQIQDPAAGGGKGKTIISRRLINDDYDTKSVHLKAPKRPGVYFLRYWNGDNRAVLAERPLTVK